MIELVSLNVEAKNNDGQTGSGTFFERSVLLVLGIDLATGLKSDPPAGRSEIPPAGKVALKCYERQSCRCLSTLMVETLICAFSANGIQKLNRLNR